jgi:2-oxoglutarate ferredoxin oxidoreductase subunit beta
MIKPIEIKYTPKDFATDQDVRWCPGCGDYAVLAAVRKALPELETKREDYVFVSGIGCAARFPYYMNTYGMHSIHGRAPAFATGIKLANPELQVWIVSGDGDLLSIGGNHTIHAMRRNIDLNIILLNNRIYGLTKGQYSPTSEFGKRTKSTPLGSVDYPINPLNMAVAAGATFIARCVDKEVNQLSDIMKRAAEHKGLSFIEVLQDCNVFNHQAWAHASEKNLRDDATIQLEHGQPLIFGGDREKGLISRNGQLETVELSSGISEEELLVHDEQDRGKAYLLAQLAHPEAPEPLGILYCNENRDTYERLVHAQMEEARSRAGKPDLMALLTDTETWRIHEEGPQENSDCGGDQ